MLDKLEKILEKNNVFLSGGAGVGKSFLTNKLSSSYTHKNKNVVILGSSALSAFNVGGVTLHSFFCLGYCNNISDLMAFDRSKKTNLDMLFQILKKTDLIIIDEISMVSAEIFDMISYRLKNSLFKGKILLVGDFFQLPPVVKKENNSLFSNSYYAFSSLFWDELNFTNVKLSVQKRTSDKQFYEYLSFIREGKINDEILNYFRSFLIKREEVHNLSDDFTLLCSTNKRADEVNERKLAKLSTPLFELDAILNKIDESLDDENMKKWANSLNIYQKLSLKIGARIIFCVNNLNKNYYNGEQGIVEDILKDDEKIILKIKKNNSETILLEPYKFELEEYSKESESVVKNVRANLLQFPIKLAYAITIHKSQGMSIANLVCDIDNIFENGQLYVALSRAIEPKNLKIVYTNFYNFNNYFIKALKFDENVCKFYKENKFLDLEGDENEI